MWVTLAPSPRPPPPSSGRQLPSGPRPLCPSDEGVGPERPPAPLGTLRRGGASCGSGPQRGDPPHPGHGWALPELHPWDAPASIPPDLCWRDPPASCLGGPQHSHLAAPAGSSPRACSSPPAPGILPVPGSVDFNHGAFHLPPSALGPPLQTQVVFVLHQEVLFCHNPSEKGTRTL